MKEVISKILKEALQKEKIKLSASEIEKILEIPPLLKMGDYAFPCFFLSKKRNTYICSCVFKNFSFKYYHFKNFIMF